MAKNCFRLVAAMLALAFPALSAAATEQPGYATSWLSEQMSRVRMIGGAAPGRDGRPQAFAGLEIALDEGWKTYWRNPGSSGVPPFVELKDSSNVAAIKVLFPAPKRFTGRDGDTIGYKHHVILPIEIEPKDPARPVVLAVAVEFGICKDICIPAQANLALSLPARAEMKPAGRALGAALSRVPRAGVAGNNDPRLESVKITLSGKHPSVLLNVRFPGEASHADIFLEAPDGSWIPSPRRDGIAADGSRRFKVDLTQGADLADLKGREIRVTMIGEKGQSETQFKFEAN
ncbi:MAG: protein-disulfide reductase DsbD domain-containing protein [Hyphomicrobiaceae bacterium]